MQPDSPAIDYRLLYEKGQAENAQLRFAIEALTHQLEGLQKLIFGSRSERFLPTAATPSPEQLSLLAGLLPEPPAAPAVVTTKVEYTKTTVVDKAPPKPHPGRMQLPERLRREVTMLLPEGDVSHLEKIGEEVTEVLDLVPAELFVKQYIRPKYAAPADAEGHTQVLTAELPSRLMEKSMAGEGLLAQIIVEKYVDHLPLHRQLQRFERAGITLAQSTINHWVRTVLTQLTALYEAHKGQVLAAGYLQADETPIRVLDDAKKGASHQGYYWVYHDPTSGAVLFDYRPGRGREGPDDILKDFTGYLQVDGYAAYEDFEKRAGIRVLNCMAHARRKFTEALSNDKGRAEAALAMLQPLYALERRIREQKLQGAAVVALRQTEALPLLGAWRAWMLTECTQVTPASPIGKAISYSLSRWEKLCVYTEDACLQIDNSGVENSIRPVAIGRKNYLFCGSHEAAQRAAMVYSLFATCKKQGIHPCAWLKDVLQRMHLYSTGNIAELLPQHWKPVAKADVG